MNAHDFDEGDLDNLAGWRGSGTNQHITVKFNEGIENRKGNDLVIRFYCGSAAQAGISLSRDNINWSNLGTISGAPQEVPGKPGFLYDAEFDFENVFSGTAYYVKVSRQSAGPKTGMFFDSFASVPEPATMLFLSGGLLFIRRRV
ncbi:hypothetical protein L21SP3_00668 [Sedimentisphaera cyanobacteriorum]|uniref:Ice-binding protein C-terminal domain-containing protein n=1 Tax=Sedimentisphaera cyanobacteriorum TaxID=1940790 RepID=A0A1Q2HNQ7_9BACT|nr:PEP-CTERM sorting domain-containing protein [Sedimentisphaera cyanobacteriorum]AQQ08875.1 hypothetical protein L21SP3_00668 [Sedimentisphaera cyanobacteriorum]